MNFVRTAIKTALYTAAVLPVAGAWALTPAQVNLLSATNIVYISGSTATDAAIQAWAKLNPTVDSTAPFAAGSYDLYKTATGYVLTGTASSVFGSTISGQNIAIVKQTKGGSATGIHNVAQGIAPGGFPDLTNPTTFGNNCTLSTSTPASSPFQAFGTYTCVLAESATIVPNAGISDEDPTTWIGTGGVTAADASALTAARAVEVPFALVASTALRNQLQSLEGLTSGSDTFANIPSLTAVQARAILSGQMSTLGDLWVANSGQQRSRRLTPAGRSSTSAVAATPRARSSRPTSASSARAAPRATVSAAFRFRMTPQLRPPVRPGPVAPMPMAITSSATSCSPARARATF